MTKTLIIVALLLLNSCTEDNQYAEILNIETHCIDLGGNYNFEDGYCIY